MSAPAFPAAFLMFILLIDSSTMFSPIDARYAGKCICLRQTIPIPRKISAQKLPVINFPSYLLILITDCQLYH